MKISDFDKYICSYLDGDLKPSDIKEFEELINTNLECKERFEEYKKMLSGLSNLETFKTSNDFLDKLNDKINNTKLSPIKKTKIIFGYDYITISGIAAAIGIFMFSVSTFMSSEGLPSFNLDKLSSKSIQNKIDEIEPSRNLIAEDDTSSENEEADLPKIHLVGGRK